MNPLRLVPPGGFAGAILSAPTRVQLDVVRAAERDRLWWIAALGTAGLVGGILVGNHLAKRGGCRGR